MQKKIFLIRHTKPQIEKGFIYGQTDLDVTDTFQQEAEAIAALFPEGFSMPVYSSPLQRCLKLANYLKKGDVTVDPRIQEMNFGDWEMKRWSELDENVLRAWVHNIRQQRAPGGESNRELGERALAFWEEVSQLDAPQIAIVSHYGIILSLLAHLLHMPIEKAFRMDLNYGTVIRITIFSPDRFKILFLK